MQDKESLKQRKQAGFTNWCYAGQRIDLMIISISGAGVYLILEILKITLAKPLNNLYYLKIAGISFILSIIFNLISQVMGKKANFYDQIWCAKQIDAIHPCSMDYLEDIESANRLAVKFDNITGWLNTTSIVVMFFALLLLVTFFLLTF